MFSLVFGVFFRDFSAVFRDLGCWRGEGGFAGIRRMMRLRWGIYIMYVREGFSDFGVEVFECFSHERGVGERTEKWNKKVMS